MNDYLHKQLSEEEEPEYRQWARDNYRAGAKIEEVWHPAVRDECRKINSEFVNAFAVVIPRDK